MHAQTKTPSRVPTDGVVIVDKPKGPTSHDVVARIRRVLSTRHVGHAGTLDPMATGVLVVAIGEATKLVPWLTADDKAYEATLLLGIGTDTLDAEGTVTERVPVPSALRTALASNVPFQAIEPLARALQAERERIEQIPPAFSALRIGGERAHELARAGKLTAELPPRPVEVRGIEFVRATEVGDLLELEVRLDVAKGYFVRAFARDLAQTLGTVGHLISLRRVRSGAFTLADACTLEELERSRVMHIEQAASRALPSSVLDDAGARAVSFGQRVPGSSISPPHRSPSAWLDHAGTLLAIGECTADGEGRVLRGFPRR
jgi:tRNA pseudouridine55 synthase